MTDSTDEKPTPRHSRVNPQEEFDFDLAAEQVIPDQANPASDQQTQAKTGSFADRDSLMPPAKIVPEIKANFYVDYFDKRKKAKTASSKPVLAADDVNTSSTIDNAGQESMTTESQPLHDEQTPDSQAPVVNGSGMAVAVLSQFKSKQESINKQQDRLIQEFSKKVKTATAVTYTAVFFGVVSLAAAAGLGLMLLQTKSELSDLAGTTTALKDDLRNIKVSPNDLEGTDPSIDQLNEKVDDVVEQMQEVELLQDKVALLEKATGVKSSAPSNKLHAHATTDPTAKKQPETVAVVKAVPDSATTKAIPAATTKATPVTAKTVKNSSVAQMASASPVAAVKPQNTSKPASKTNTSTKKESEIDKAIAIPANDINNVVNSNSPQTVTSGSPPQVKSSNSVTPQVKTNNSTAPANVADSPQQPKTASSGWTVNLASSNRLEDAKRSANSFTQKGIPVTISTFTVKNQTRYRLQVKGFKTREEAAAYANKAKDVLKLNSVWINP
jgi:hypothetical protein